MKTKTYSDKVVEILKARYFRLLAKENYPRTPAITSAADHLEKAIRASVPAV